MNGQKTGKNKVAEWFGDRVTRVRVTTITNLVKKQTTEEKKSEDHMDSN